MTKRLFFLLFLITNTLQMAKGAYAAGGEMKVSHIGNNKYLVTLIANKPCGSMISYPTTTTLNVQFGLKGACGTTTLTMSQTNTREVNSKCSTSTTCSANNSLIEYTYQCTADLNSTTFTKPLSSGTCQEITFYHNAFYHAFYGLIPGTCSDGFLTAATLYVGNLNRCKSKTNIAPVSIFDPTHLIPVYKTTTIAQGMVDTNEYDWLHFVQMPSFAITPYANTTCSYSKSGNYLRPIDPVCVPSTSTTCSYNGAANPVRGANFDTLSGDFTFAPANSGDYGVLSYHINEYRKDTSGKWTLICRYFKEVPLYVIDAPADNNNPTISTLVSQPINICVGSNYCNKVIQMNDVMAAPKQSSSDSLLTYTIKNVHGSPFNVYAPNKYTRAFEICWTPKNADTSYVPYLIPIKVTDQHCSPPLEMSFTLQVRIFPVPQATNTVRYLGCNKVEIKTKNLRGGPGAKCLWQISKVNSNFVATSYKSIDTIDLEGLGKYSIKALMSNAGSCFSFFDTTLTLSDTVVDFSLGNKKPIADTFNCPSTTFIAKPYNLSYPAGKLTYQWYGVDYVSAYTFGDPKNIDKSKLQKLGTASTQSLKLQKDSVIMLAITDSKGCTVVRELRITQIISSDIQWKKKPLAAVCGNAKSIALLDPMNKDMIYGGAQTGIRCLDGKFLDSIGPNYYKIKSPAKPKTSDYIKLTFVATYDTLGCLSRDTNSIDLIYRPQFSLTKNAEVCTTTPGLLLEKIVAQTPKKASPFDWTLLSSPNKSNAQIGYTTTSPKKAILLSYPDSIAVGKYKISACANDSALGCRFCDTTIVTSVQLYLANYLGDTLACPHSAPIELNKGLKLYTGQSADTIYGWKVTSINGDTSRLLSGFSKGIVNNTFQPAAASGRWLLSYKASKPCYQASNVSILVQDTLPITISSNPDTLITLPKTSFNFTANTKSTRIHWDFGTGNPSDTANLNPINWSFANSPANYLVKAQSFHPNGCYGIAAKSVKVVEFSGTQEINATHFGYTNELKFISTQFVFQQLSVYNMNGQLVFHTKENVGVPAHQLPPGMYTFVFEVKIDLNPQAKIHALKGKWINTPAE
jgi:hypothetical protein